MNRLIRFSLFIATVGLVITLFPSSKAFGAGGGCPTGSDYLNTSTNNLTTLSSLGVTTCYFIAANGADTNNGTSEATPWAHAPGMATCSNVCAGVTPAAGVGFIFRGGDSWGPGNYLVINNGGNSNSPVYYGVDKTWYSGSAWNRPIFSIGGSLPNLNQYGESRIFDFKASWVTVDWFEITGGTCSTAPTSQNYFWNDGTFDGIVVTNGYFHAFQAPSGGCGSAKLGDGNNPGVWIYSQIGSSNSSCHGVFDYNVVDGTDGSGAKGYLTVVADPSPCATFAFNVIHDVCSGIGGNFTLAHDNVIGNFGGQVGQYECASSSTIHNHAIRSNNDATIYNNTIYSTESEVISVNPNSGSPGSLIYNNVLWHNNASAIDICDNGSGTCDSGSVSIFNNTIEQQTGGENVYNNCVNLENNISNLLIENNFFIYLGAPTATCINASNPPFNVNGKGKANSVIYNASNDLFQTLAQANAAGYSNSQTYYYSPTASNSPTVGIGVTGIASRELSDTSYACNQATVNGVVQAACPVRAPVARAASGACTLGVPGCADAGAYQFGGGGGQPVPPSGMSAVVQ
jgi:hypothetical protein